MQWSPVQVSEAPSTGTVDSSGVSQQMTHRGEQTIPTLHSTTISDGARLAQAAAQQATPGAASSDTGATATLSEHKPSSSAGDATHAGQNGGSVRCITKSADGKANRSR